MRVAVEKLAGVTSAEVSLEEGLVTVQMTPDNQLTMAELQRAIRNQGFSPRGAEIQLSGALVEEGQRLALELPGSQVSYTIRADGILLERLRSAIGRHVTLAGRLGEDEDGRTPTILEVSSVLAS